MKKFAFENQIPLLAVVDVDEFGATEDGETFVSRADPTAAYGGRITEEPVILRDPTGRLSIGTRLWRTSVRLAHE